MEWPSVLRCFCQTTILAVFTLVSSVAFAQDPVDEAFKAFENGDFVGAANGFKGAYDATGDGVLKLNEMVAWWRAGRCEDAMTAHGEALNAVPEERREEDTRDLNKVEADCGYKSARALFEKDDLDGAEAALQDLRTVDANINQAIGALRVEIKNRRSELAAIETPPVDPPPNVAPVRPAPRWALWTGVGLTSVGAGLGVATLIKWQIERGDLEDGYNVIAKDYDCTYSLKDNNFKGTMCDEIALRADDRYDLFEKEQVKLQSVVNGTMGVAAGVLGVGGMGFLTYYFIRNAKHSKYEKSQMTFVPDFRPGYSGAVFQLTF